MSEDYGSDSKIGQVFASRCVCFQTREESAIIYLRWSGDINKYVKEADEHWRLRHALFAEPSAVGFLRG